MKNNLKAILAIKGIKAKQMSRDTGITEATISNLASGSTKGIRFDTLETICVYLNVTPNDLFWNVITFTD
uniref:helix-turn-helix domain-containing protein n=1 Tax=Aerococcus urinaeequi TaxID=51665 RepID=UPI00352B6A0E